MRIALPVSWLIVIVLYGAATAQCASSMFAETFCVSIPPMKLRSAEAIYAFAFDTQGALIIRNKVPLSWNVTIDNSDGDRSHMQANAVVGAWAFRTGSLGYFRNFAEVGRENPDQKPPPPPFDMKLTLKITDDATGKERTIVVPIHKMRTTAQCSGG